jgi:hypothetical protein
VISGAINSFSSRYFDLVCSERGRAFAISAILIEYFPKKVSKPAKNLSKNSTDCRGRE